jgi:two-component system cell cycle sensor histidine kinase/response regulator CckA
MEASSHKTGATILIVDDNPANLAVLTHALAERGFHVLVAQRGDTSIQIARRALPDLILLDVQMPELDGFEVCQRLKADPTTAAIAVLFMTVRVEPEDKLKGFAAGAVDYITKPFQLEEVLARVSTHVQLHKLTNSLTLQNAQLQAAEAALRKANEELELRVQERTAELLQANRDLQAQIGERERAEAELVSERNLLRTLIDSLPDRVYVKDGESRFVLVNAATTHYHKADTPAELLGKSDFDLFTPALAARFRAYEQAIMLSGQPLVNQEEADVDPRTGAQTWMLVTKVPVRSADGQVTGLVGLHRDITLRKQLEAQFIQSQKMEGIGRLAGGMAHDFNNLLTVITGYVEMASDTMRPGDPLYGDLQQIREAARRATALTRQLLVFARKQILDPQTLHLNEVVLNVEKLLRRLIGEDIELIVVPELDVWPVRADANQIEQVLVNLVINACDAMPGGGKLTIELMNIILDESYALGHRDVPPGHYVILAVSDTGSGIPPSLLPHIFEPFFTTKEVGKGTGLGLSTCYGIVKQHSGHIWVYSEVDRGTTIKIYLPATTMAVGERLPEMEIEIAHSDGETVLLAEDETAVRQLAARVLKQLGYRVLEASSGADTLRIAASYHEDIDLLLTDVVMPQLGGAQLAERIRELYPQIKVLFMSGYTDRVALSHSLLRRNAAFLQKPFTPALLAQKVRDILTAGHDEEGAGGPGRASPP